MSWRGIKIFLTGSVATVFVIFPFANVWASEITADKVIELVNGARLAENVGVLTKDETLMRVARMKVDDMFEKGYFAHNSPEGKTPWTWFDKAGYAYEYAGENLAIHFVQAEEQQRAWMESPTHRKNILNPEYLEIGVAVRRGVFDGKETTITVQEFGRREKTIETTALISFSDDAISGEKTTSPKSFSPDSVIVSNEEKNRTYERILTIFWIVMMAQIIVLGYGVWQSSIRAHRGKHTVFIHTTKENERVYRVPVTVFSKKTVR